MGKIDRTLTENSFDRNHGDLILSSVTNEKFTVSKSNISGRLVDCRQLLWFSAAVVRTTGWFSAAAVVLCGGGADSLIVTGIGAESLEISAAVKAIVVDGAGYEALVSSWICLGALCPLADLELFQLQGVAHTWFKNWKDGCGADIGSVEWDEFVLVFLDSQASVGDCGHYLDYEWGLVIRKIIPPRRSDIRGNFSIPLEDNVDEAHPTQGVETQSTVSYCDCPSGVPLVPTNPSPAGDAPDRSP
ncbi:hypothetical protein FXO38_21693 [Capsicum annuum]|nr:hypothetical protein FXO38_21693 [Capsicum annuum]